ncbi:helix-turn-helix domain-containing protein [Pseudoflavitalea sp. X16]|uniref:GlxA family transcriptional regulator n=1 Tax=Paraflavitalea devenefica TaxID=2716334 RepID=UPI0014212236|nr:helix-turn-helix domain-containing protein [Paraflavitalea devenefica]NII27029.1 helix-turn-helix domain-containing protein [Paraflavitalea devenefica]
MQQKHVSILVPEGQNNVSSIIGPYKILNKADEYWRKLGHESVFRVQVVGLSKTVELYDGLFTIRPHACISEIDHTDLIIIPALSGDFAAKVPFNVDYLPWIREQHAKGAEVASICTGAFILAATGLLDGRQCSTHWNAANSFRKLYPEVELVTEKIFTDEQGIYTNGGAFSFLHLLLYLVEKFYNRSVAIFCSKVFQVEMDRFSQSPFTIFSGQKEHDDDLVKKAQLYMEQNMGEKIGVDQLASQLNINRRSFDRRFIKATGNTPLEYLQRVRIEAAKKALETSHISVNEVLYEVGYADIKAFRQVFKKITGLSPLEYRARYNKAAIPEKMHH